MILFIEIFIFKKNWKYRVLNSQYGTTVEYIKQ